MSFPDRRPISSTVLYDEDGNPVGVIQDGYDTIYRFQTEAVIVGKDPDTGPNQEVTVIDDIDTSTIKRLQVEADIKPGAVIRVSTGAAVASGAVAELLKDTGGAGSFDMVVDGSSTPVKYEFNADPVHNIQLTSVRLVMSASFFNFIGEDFGKGGGELPNGITINIVANGGEFTGQIAALTVNEDFFRLLEFAISQSGSTDVMAASLVFGGGVFLEAGTSDEISVTINDDLTSGARGISYLTGTVYGIEEL
jgi:hypothetical protein